MLGKNEHRINMILLAAGNSRRFGGNKLLVEIQGKPLYKHALIATKKAKDIIIKKGIDCNIIMVTRYEEIVEETVNFNCITVPNDKPELGISHSIKLGILAAMELDDKHSNTSDIFVVADQPFINGESICALVSEFLENNKPMGCLSYGGQLGNPCIFHCAYRDKLLELEGDMGGKKIILSEPENVLKVECLDKNELIDIDTEQTLAEIEEKINTAKP